MAAPAAITPQTGAAVLNAPLPEVDVGTVVPVALLIRLFCATFASLWMLDWALLMLESAAPVAVAAALDSEASLLDAAPVTDASSLEAFDCTVLNAPSAAEVKLENSLPARLVTEEKTEPPFVTPDNPELIAPAAPLVMLVKTPPAPPIPVLRAPAAPLVNVENTPSAPSIPVPIAPPTTEVTSLTTSPRLS